MNTQTHLLKKVRTRAEITQQHIAFLLDIDTSTLARYESEKRIPTPEILLMYHVLFGVPISELLAPLLEKVKEKLLHRSTLLHTMNAQNHFPKNIHSSSYIQAVVDNLKQTKTYDL